RPGAIARPEQDSAFVVGEVGRSRREPLWRGQQHSDERLRRELRPELIDDRPDRVVLADLLAQVRDILLTDETAAQLVHDLLGQLVDDAANEVQAGMVVAIVPAPRPVTYPADGRRVQPQPVP